MSYLVPDTWELVLTVAVIVSTCITIFLATLPASYTPFHPGLIKDSDFSEEDRKHSKTSGYDFYAANMDESGRYATKTTVQVVVLGDIGRSPRMQYHALSLAKHGAGVQLIGYNDSPPSSDVTRSRFIKVIGIDETPARLQTSSKMLFPLIGPLKALFQAWALYKALAYQSKAARFMLVQNPPSIPVLAVAVFVCFFRNTQLIIDWHNFGYSILALKLGSGHPLVKVSRWYEGFVSQAAAAHFTVTDAMQRKVKADFGIAAVTLHDRPAQQFQPASAAQRTAFLRSCEATSAHAENIETGLCRLVVSSTSWTADEDFGILLDALVAYSAARSAQPHLLVVITGKGPLKAHYQQRIEKLQAEGKLSAVSIRLAWLSLADYAAILAAADLGISLHTSSSGVDLPMKVLDMFGAGLPVAGWSKYESWPELVHEGVNGVGFGSAAELNDILARLFAAQRGELSSLKRGALNEGKYRWDDEWDKAALSIFRLSS